MAKQTTLAHQEAYERDGVAMVQGALGESQLHLLAEAVGKVIAAPSKRHVYYVNEGPGGKQFFYDAVLMPEIEELNTAIRESSLGELVAAAMKSKTATAFYASIFSRTGGMAKRTPWHQDQPYWPAEGWQACSTWMSLDPVPRPTALEFVRGSHEWAPFRRPDFSDVPREGYLAGEENRAKPFPDIEANRKDYDIIGWEMNPGDCLLFHGMAAHGGSGGDLPSVGRRSISIQWLGDDGIYAPKAGGVDPDFRAEYEAAGVWPGGPFACKLCPVLWPPPSQS